MEILCPFNSYFLSKMNREIPGFYYDPEKKKYFKIQANHAAPPGSQYSKDAVKRKCVEQEKQQRKVRLSHRAAKEKIRKAGFLAHPLIGLEKQIGAHGASKGLRLEWQGQAYVSQLQRRRLHRFEPWPSRFSVGHIVRSKISGVLVAGGNHGANSSVSFCVPEYSQGKQTYPRRMEHAIFKEPYRLSSISLSHTGYLLATMDSGPNGDSFLGLLMLPDPTVDGIHYSSSTFTDAVRIRIPESLWCSAPCPTGQNALFAVGTSDGLYTVEGVGYRWTLSKKPFPNNVLTGRPVSNRHIGSSHAVVTSVEWLSSDVIACGLKDSAVFLHDLRSGGTATRLQHPHSVSKIRRVDSYRLVVAGQKSLNMYDIRYPPNGLQRNPKPTRSGHTSTRPYVTFPEYSPEVLTPDFDLSTELNILASASDSRKIQLFSLRTGQQLPSCSYSSSYLLPITEYKYPSPISCVRFEDYTDVDLAPLTFSSHSSGLTSASLRPKLLVSSGDVVDEWSW